MSRCQGCTSATGCDDCPAERCARSSCRVERREHDDHPNACKCFIDEETARQIQAWKREAYEKRQLEDYWNRSYATPQLRVAEFLETATHVCTWTPHPWEYGQLLKSCCGDWQTVEPLRRKQIWLPSFQDHVAFGTLLAFAIYLGTGALGPLFGSVVLLWATIFMEHQRVSSSNR